MTPVTTATETFVCVMQPKGSSATLASFGSQTFR